MKQLTPYLCAFAVLTLVSVPALAGNDVTLIDPPAVQAQGGYPYTIVQPGSYRLSANLAVDTGNAAFNIASPNVVLDLNGFNVSCKSCPNEPGILVQARGITVMNGTVTGFGNNQLWGGAIVVAPNAGLDLKGVTVTNSYAGVDALAHSVVSVSDCNIYKVTTDGISFSGDGLIVRNSTIQTLSAQYRAIYVGAGTALITGNVIRDNGFGVSVSVEAAHAQVTGNNFAQNSTGVYGGGSTLVSSNIFTNGLEDFSATHVISMHNNVCSSSTVC